MGVGSVSGATIAAYAGVATAVAGAATGAVSAASSAAAQKAQANYQAQVAANNATIASQNAARARQAGQAQAQAQGMKNRAQQGAAIAGMAANGVDVNSGSDLNVQETQKQLGRLDTLTTVNNAEQTAYGYSAQEAGFQATSGLQQMTAGQAGAAGALGVGTSLISGASSVNKQYQTYKNAGVPGFGDSAVNS